ncbi:MAG: cytidylate kinase-like family protein, partial [Eubacteriales bacterium]|nr:cytidylate kinase-like family protein [Eubacteriales bacterium]
MENSEKKIVTDADLRNLAKRIYDLDTRVYNELESELGRVFLLGDQTVERIKRDLSSRERSDIVRHELALISNMARTIENEQIRKSVLIEYNKLLKEVLELPNSFGQGDILSERSAALNALYLDNRFGENDHLIICIGRSYGSAGCEIGFALADALRINYYDQEILEATRNRLASAYVPEDPDYGTLKDKWHKFVQFHGLSEKDAIFFNQSGFLVDLAKNEDFVIMGRYADQILTNAGIPHVSIFITTSFDVRVKRTMITTGMTEKAVRKMLVKKDKESRKDYRFYTGHRWGFIQNYDFCINSSSYGIDGSVDMILRLLNRSRHKHNAENFGTGEVIETPDYNVNEIAGNADNTDNTDKADK